ncbi:twin-arginine translocase TatA/TatE family subunit [Fundidesulfovibrio soli]|uniref:twin-arginine translocase TatA/TatE family subunit n=1 Tax=Fundidesulfovibrio soli TaxID=2922716 RepID=UPI001FAFBB16|nr:twin-arginine translocase TatA/TatE family subunit [Fundidesulfovibrio soli]
MGITGLLVIILVVLVLFNGSKLPGLGKSLGKAIREFKRSSREDGPKDGDH